LAEYRNVCLEGIGSFSALSMQSIQSLSRVCFQAVKQQFGVMRIWDVSASFKLEQTF
jgi:hypothetical protein